MCYYIFGTFLRDGMFKVLKSQNIQRFKHFEMYDNVRSNFRNDVVN